MNLLEHCIVISNKTTLVFEVKSTASFRLELDTVEDRPNMQYKIKLSGGENQLSTLLKPNSVLDDTHAGEVLDGKIFKAFWIKWKDGIVSVGNGYHVDTGTILSITDPDPLTVTKVRAHSSGNDTAYLLVHI